MSEALNGIITSFNASLTDMVSAAMTGLGTILPTILPIFAALILIGIVIKVVRRITGR